MRNGVTHFKYIQRFDCQPCPSSDQRDGTHSRTLNLCKTLPQHGQNSSRYPCRCHLFMTPLSRVDTLIEDILGCAHGSQGRRYDFVDVSRTLTIETALRIIQTRRVTMSALEWECRQSICRKATLVSATRQTRQTPTCAAPSLHVSRGGSSTRESHLVA